jgi:ectoine hydrolase
MQMFEKLFPPAEFKRRVQDVKSRMQKAGFDLIVCQDPANMCWLTGYDGWSFYVPQCVLVHVEEEMPIWFGLIATLFLFPNRWCSIPSTIPTMNLPP